MPQGQIAFCGPREIYIGQFDPSSFLSRAGLI